MYNSIKTFCFIERYYKFMDKKVIVDKQDLTYLKWSRIRNSGGTAGNFLKSQSVISGNKIYYKLSNFDSEKGIIGHECINEIIVDRLLTILGIEHLYYSLIHADVDIDGKLCDTYICASADFKKTGESKAALDDFYQANNDKNESHYDFCVSHGWQKHIDTMLAVDFLILNRDRHGANIEILRNQRQKTLRIAPLFDHGLSLLCTCYNDTEIDDFDVMKDRPCNNFIGSRSTLENLRLINSKSSVFPGRLKEKDKDFIFEDIFDAVSEKLLNRIWEMIYKRWCYYEELCNS